MEQIIIIGAGAAGLMASVIASESSNCITVLEHNNKAGKKLYATGNGRCNLINKDQSLTHFHTNAPDSMTAIIEQVSIDKYEEIFNNLGILFSYRGDYAYPKSNQASSVVSAMYEKALSKRVKFEFNTHVSDIYYEKDKKNYVITTLDKRIFVADKVLLTGGLLSGEHMGNDGSCLEIAQTIKLATHKPLPALTAIMLQDAITKKWSGVRTEAVVQIKSDQINYDERGEVQLTEYGISGIVIFNISHHVSEALLTNKHSIIQVDFMPSMSFDDLYSYIDFAIKQHEYKTIETLLSNLLNAKLVKALLDKLCIDGNKKIKNISKEEIEKILHAIKTYEMIPYGTKDFEFSQVSRGGVDLSEINTKTMECQRYPNLYLAGELLDVNGDCGGYNLQWAFTTGYLAGMAMKES